MTGKDAVFIDVIEFALDWGFKPCKKQMDKYFDLIKRRRLGAVQSARRKAMFDRGYEADEVKAICERVDYVADSMVDDYVRF